MPVLDTGPLWTVRPDYPAKAGSRDNLRVDRALAVGMAFAVTGCMPPPMNMGYVAMDPSRRGGVDVQGQAGGGTYVPDPWGFGGATAQVEPFVTPRVSVPIGTGVIGSQGMGFSALRVGVRHRATRWFAYGGGIGPAISFDAYGTFAAGAADVELIAGTQTPQVGFSLGVRPSLVFASGTLSLYLLAEPTLAIPLVEETSLTIAVLAGGFFYPEHDVQLGLMGGALGVHRRF